MTDQRARLIRIELSVNEGYESMTSQSIKVPATTDFTLVGRMVERKLSEMMQTVEDFYPAPPMTPIESESVVR